MGKRSFFSKDEKIMIAVGAAGVISLIGIYSGIEIENVVQMNKIENALIEQHNITDFDLDYIRVNNDYVVEFIGEKEENNTTEYGAYYYQIPSETYTDIKDYELIHSIATFYDKEQFGMSERADICNQFLTLIETQPTNWSVYTSEQIKEVHAEAKQVADYINKAKEAEELSM